MDSTTDVNTIMANCERTFANNVMRFRQAARDAVVHIDRPENRDIQAAMRQQAAQANAVADRWEARRVEAARGFFRAVREDLNDPDYIGEFSDAMSAAQGAGRVVYHDSTQEDTMQRSEGTGGR
jgi:hypothetical protein